MTGKEKCEILRSIRRQIAKTNRVPLPAWMEEECSYQGNDCKGTCPKCEKEIHYLEDMLNIMVAAGMKLRLSGISADAIPSETSGRKSGFHGYDIPDLPAGVMVPPDLPVRPPFPPDPLGKNDPEKIPGLGEEMELMGDMIAPDWGEADEVMGYMTFDDTCDDASGDL